MSPDDHYKLIIEEHRFASEFRLKILAVWGAVYTALAAVFVWMYSAAMSIDWIVPLVGFVMTILLWIGDCRNRVAIGRSKDIGENLERKLNIPDDLQFFAKLGSCLSHSRGIDIFGIAISVMLLASIGYLLCTSGELPQ